MNGAVGTPAYVYDVEALDDSARAVRQVTDEAGCTALFAVKACAFVSILRRLAHHVEGFAVSSLHEARLVRNLTGAAGRLHFTSPGLRPGEAAELAGLCDYVAFNSISQWQALGPVFAAANVSMGVRVNPGLSLVTDERYDPCRPHSKLGAGLDELAAALDSGLAPPVRGVHFHTNCDGESFEALARTVARIEAGLGSRLERLDWINLGGGYLFEACSDADLLQSSVAGLKRRYGVDVFVEPGAAFVAGAGRLVATVVDRFERDGLSVAVLDTTVNHLPEVFEYQFEPDLADVEEGDYPHLLVGGSCLAGDVFGRYDLRQPLEVGARVAFAGAGAYAGVKEHSFNGIGLPRVYLVDAEGRTALKRALGFEHFADKCGRE